MSTNEVTNMLFVTQLLTRQVKCVWTMWRGTHFPSRYNVRFFPH